MSENKFRKQLRDFLWENGYRVHIIENKVAPGMPDLLVIPYAGELIWIEVKTGTNLNKNQIMWADKHQEEKVFIVKYCYGKFKLTRKYPRITSTNVLYEELYSDVWPLKHPDKFLDALEK